MSSENTERPENEDDRFSFDDYVDDGVFNEFNPNDTKDCRKKNDATDLPDLEPDILKAIVQHLAIIDHIHLIAIYGTELTKYTFDSLFKCYSFSASYRGIRRAAAIPFDDHLREYDFTRLADKIMRIVGPIAKEITLNLDLDKSWILAPSQLYKLVISQCNRMQHLKVYNFMYGLGRIYASGPKQVPTPQMNNLETIAFKDTNPTSPNQDVVIENVLRSSTCTKLRQVTVTESRINGHFLRRFADGFELESLCLRSNHTMLEMIDGSRGVIHKLPMSIGAMAVDLWRISVKRLELRQERLSHQDINCIATMPGLIDVTLELEMGTSQMLNDFLRECLRQDRLQSIDVSSAAREKLCLDTSTVALIYQSTKLKRVCLYNLLSSDWVLKVLQLIRKKRSFVFTLSPYRKTYSKN